MNSIEEALDALKAGKLILTVDDPDRENEGDLICAAEFATTENVNFMATHANMHADEQEVYQKARPFADGYGKYR